MSFNMDKAYTGLEALEYVQVHMLIIMLSSFLIGRESIVHCLENWEN